MEIIRIKNRNIVYGLLISMILVSCHGNDLYLNKEYKTVYSPYEIKKLSVRTNHRTYFIYSKKGRIGDNYIRLDSITDSYVIYEKDTIVAKKNNTYNLIHANDSYEISNFTVGDATAWRISFRTNKFGYIIDVNCND